MSLKTSSTTVENHSLSFNNEANKKLGLDKLEQQSKKKFIGKRSNSPDSEHMSKKIKLEVCLFVSYPLICIYL